MLLAFNKPYACLSQFMPDGSSNRTLAEFGFPPNVYPLGRLDADSEGLLLLSDEPSLNSRLLNPKNAHERWYWAQVEKIPTTESLKKLAEGLMIQNYHTRSIQSFLLDPQPMVSPRNPPIRLRTTVPDCWIVLKLTEGKNRQVRRMTAAIGHPTLRLIRTKIGKFELGELPVGTWRKLDARERAAVFA